MSLKRTVATLLICGLVSLLFFAWLDGSWPSHSPQEWLVLVGGLVVLGFVFYAAESLIRKNG